jgi:hypothetical protein
VLPITTIHFEVNAADKVRELISKGENALNVQIDCADVLAIDAGGSFHIAQILCHEICLNDGVTEGADQKKSILTSVKIGHSVEQHRYVTSVNLFLPRRSPSFFANP